jgi:hypothetical protein
LVRNAGYVLHRASDVVVLPRLPAGPAVSACPGLDRNLAAAGDIFARTLPRFRDEWGAFPRDAAPGRYGYANPYFSLVDAAVCHALVRERRPPLVVEVGSGYSTLVLRGALDRNGAGRLISIDPEPRIDVSAAAHELRRTQAQQVPVAFFRELPPGAILFIDSSHRAGPGSDVNHLLLEVVPALAPGVLVHVHDIYLPEDYPAGWNVDEGWHYTEQYLLQALLSFSSGLRVLWPARKVLRERDSELAGLFPDRELRGLACSFWMERV